MAFHHILQALTSDADARIAAARTAQRAAIDAARADAENATLDRLAAIRAECERKKKNMERQVTAHAHMAARQAALAAKHRLVEDTYAKALEMLAGLDAKQTEALLSRLLASCPDGGVIRPAEPHAALLKKLAGNREIGDAVKASGGFVFVSDKAERDCTYDSLVRDVLRPATELDVASTLFPARAA